MYLRNFGLSQHYNPEDCALYIHFYENFRSNNLQFVKRVYELLEKKSYTLQKRIVDFSNFTSCFFLSLALLLGDYNQFSQCKNFQIHGYFVAGNNLIYKAIIMYRHGGKEQNMGQQEYQHIHNTDIIEKQIHYFGAIYFLKNPDRKASST